MTSIREYFRSRIQQRWVFAVLGFLGMTSAHTMRFCLFMAITVMVKTKNKTSNRTMLNDVCPAYEPAIANSSKLNGGTYEWDEYTQGIILSSFSSGYVLSMIPSGMLAQKFGGKFTFGLGILLSAILTLVTPIIIQVYDATGLTVVRFIIGVCEGTTVPASSVLVAQWAPAHERTKISSIVNSGAVMGSVLGTAVTGVLIHNSPIGWPIVFYFFGSLGILWFICWICLCFDNPDAHPFITDKERNYIRERTSTHARKQTQSTPWRHILKSAPVWALMVGKAGLMWGVMTITTDLPKYMSDVLKFSIRTNGFLSAVPHVMKMVVAILTSWLCDSLIKSNKMSRTNVRKTTNTLATILSAILLLAASYSGCNRTKVVILFTFGVGVMGLSGPCTIRVNANDLSPNYAGILASFTSVLGAFFSMLAPYVIGILTPNRALSEWKIVFWITSVILCISGLIFHLWADGEVQYWNDPDFRVEKQQGTEKKEEVPFLEDSKSTENKV